MTTTSKAKIEKAERLAKISAKRKALADEEKELKGYFKEVIGGSGALQAGDILVVVSDKKRSSLDRKALEAQFGKDVIAEYLKVTEYLQVEAKVVGS